MSQSLRIPIPQVLASHLGVFFTPGGATPDVLAIALQGVAARAPGQIGAAAMKLFEAGIGRVLLLPRRELPEPPIDLVRAMGMGEEEGRRFERATHVAFVGVSYRATPPPFHYWASLAAADALAASLNGVILDPMIPRLLPIDPKGRAIPEDGSVIIVRDVVAPMSRQRDGTVLITTKGLGRFGLPEVHLGGVPPSVGADALPLVNALAQRLIHLLYTLTEAEPRADTLVTDDELHVDLHDLAASYGKRFEETDARGVEVRLSLDTAPDRDTFVMVDPPRKFRGQRGEWLHEALASLVGMSPQPALAHRTSGDDALRTATERARRELPGVRTRFASGLEPGAKLFVKRGFPVRGGGSEFMWVAVLRWSDDAIDGALANESAYDPQLRAGHSVRFPDADVTDWMIRGAKGEMEGGYSIKALAQ